MSLARLVITAVTVEGRSKSEVARDYGVSRVWVQKLVHRYQREGPAAFEPRSRRPHTNPRAVDLEVEDQIVRLRKTLTKKGAGRGRGDDRRAPGRRPGCQPVPAVSTIWRILSRRGFVTPQPQKRPRSSWQRFCADQPNERWQADITHWRLADGTEVEILNILDDHSRLCIAADARRIITGAAGGRHLPRRVRPLGHPGQRAHRQRGGLHRETTRRGPGRAGGRSSACAASGLSHSRPYHPQTCGKVERFHQTQKKWLAAQPRAATIAGLQRQLNRFAGYYNTVRPHRALDRRTPAQAYAARPKAVPTGPVIPAHYRVRTRQDRHRRHRHPPPQQPAAPHRPRRPPRRHPASPCSSTTCTSASSTATPAS